MHLTITGKDLTALALIIGAFVMIALGHGSVFEGIIIAVGIGQGVISRWPPRKLGP
ncbi:hypothetical protein ES703_37179 [subsurface metagenome]